MTQSNLDPPFTIATLRKSIPSELFIPNVFKSLCYFARDYTIITVLIVAATYFNSWFFWPIYWFCQGTMFWALFALGHDCGHLSFAKSHRINHLFGYLTHTPLLIPYHSFRISHLKHHLNAGHAENEEGWVPFTETEYKNKTIFNWLLRHHLFFIAFPFYLIVRDKNKSGSHFLPSSPLFKPQDRKQVLVSSFLCFLFLLSIILLSFFYGWGTMAKLYWGPYLVFAAYYGTVTLLHHTDLNMPWYRDGAWSFFRGAFCTVDRDLGVIDALSHNLGTHMIHHLFMNIPHYHLKEATKSIIPILGSYYRKSDIPFFKALYTVYRNCLFIPDEGDIVYYQNEIKSESPDESSENKKG